MDFFTEQIVKKIKTRKDLNRRQMIIILSAVLFLFCMFMGFRIIAVFLPVFLLIGIGQFYGAYLLLSDLNVEYEYIITNGELDIDKILGEKKRSRILSTNIQKFEEFGVFDIDTHSDYDVDTRILACIAVDEPDTYYATFTHAIYGKTLLVFNPNEKVLELVGKYCPKKANLIAKA